MHSHALARTRKLVGGGSGQVLLFVAALILYFFARGLTAGDSAIAISHAHALNNLEASLHVNVEAAWQHYFLHSALLWVFSHVYLAAQFVVTPIVLFALYFRARRVYGALRNVLLCGWALALPLYALYPCAPPRLAHIGVVDTVSTQTAVNLHSSSALSFYNEYAAMPSMHVGFALAVAVALFVALARWRRLRYLVFLWPPLVLLAVVVTGNHFLLDGVAGVAVVAFAFALNRYVFAACVRRHRSKRG
jgi:membrane-associated phospholipid phosphatase